jgi:hypothetical protein
MGGEARGKETTRKTKKRCADDIKMVLVETGWAGVDWIGLTQDRDKW